MAMPGQNFTVGLLPVGLHVNHRRRLISRQQEAADTSGEPENLGFEQPNDYYPFHWQSKLLLRTGAYHLQAHYKHPWGTSAIVIT